MVRLSPAKGAAEYRSGPCPSQGAQLPFGQSLASAERAGQPVRVARESEEREIDDADEPKLDPRTQARIRDFLEEYRQELRPEAAENAYRFNLASLRYAQGQLSAALQLLQQVEFHDVFYDLSARSLMLRLYFENDEDAALEFLLETFRRFLQRNRALSQFQRDIHLNLLRFTKKLYRLREQKDIQADEVFSQRMLRLQEMLMETEVANRSWLAEQINRVSEGE